MYAVLLLAIGVNHTQALHGGGDVGEPRGPADVLHLLQLLDSSVENAAEKPRGDKRATEWSQWAALGMCRSTMHAPRQWVRDGTPNWGE